MAVVVAMAGVVAVAVTVVVAGVTVAAAGLGTAWRRGAKVALSVEN